MEILILRHKTKGIVAHVPECRHVEVERSNGNVTQEWSVEVEDADEVAAAILEETGLRAYLSPCVKKEL